MNKPTTRSAETETFVAVMKQALTNGYVTMDSLLTLWHSNESVRAGLSRDVAGLEQNVEHQQALLELMQFATDMK